ncbi:hypothetical protein [Candidatus Formimonas warabiya]|uniref:Chemotaxis protein CheX n=1 Tax=Formimonas warabiya TaxID=1761012 RepID=A0A3G1KYM5_FORW1|nr:hypothetical protein [Candidatus Formimonas warabiya]ATW27459.1 hypothetical protein DCMF_24320 [Candidatus Formimonas warabiya]
MFNQYFGNYLLEKRIVTPEQLRVVLAEQKSIKVKLGVLAIDSGYMNAAQVNQIHRLQAARDKKFGELAVEKGYLTEEKLDDLLKAQKKSNVLLGQALIEKGYLTFEKYEGVLLQYHEDSGFGPDEMKALKDNDVKKIVDIFLKTVDRPDNGIYHDYLELFIRNLVRFIDDEIRVEEAEEIDSYPFHHFITQRMDGQHPLFTGFSGAESTLARFASLYAQEACPGMDAMAKDALAEFLNCHNGLFLSNLSHQGVELELYPSEVKENGILRPVKKLYRIPCYLSFGEIDVIFSDASPSYL